MRIAGAIVVLAMTTGMVHAEESLVLYSGRERHLVEPILEKFEEKTGIDVEVDDSVSLAARLPGKVVIDDRT